VNDARWRLETFAAAMVPPPSFTPIVYDVPPRRQPKSLRRPSDAGLQRSRIRFRAATAHRLPGSGAAYLVFPPPPPIGLFVLPVPVFVPVPLWANPPPM